MAWATYHTSAPKLLDRYYRTEALANARIADPPHDEDGDDIPLSKKGGSDYRLPARAVFGEWVFDDTADDFVEPAMGQADELQSMKLVLAGKAKMLDDAIRGHWGRQARGQSQFETLPTATEAQRLDNTFDWGRSFIGLAWLEILKLEGDATAAALEMVGSATAALTLAGVREVYEQVMAELPNHDHIYFWYAAHTPPDDTGWRNWLDNRRVYTTTAVGGGVAWKVARYYEIPQATWDAIMGYYETARKYAAGIGV